MFQLDIAKLLQRLAQHCDFAVVSECERSSRVSELSIFSFSSEILEKSWEPDSEDGGNDWLKDRAAFRIKI